MKKEMTFEQALTRLEQIVAVLEQGESALDDTMKLFNEGVELAGLCNQKLNDAEQKVNKMMDVKKADGAGQDEQQHG